MTGISSVLSSGSAACSEIARLIGSPSCVSFFDTWDNTAGRNRHVPVTHIQRIFPMQELQCADNGVKIKHRFAAAHNDNTTDLLTFSDQHTVKKYKPVLKISAAVRLRMQPLRPLAQKAHPISQPTWLDTQTL